MCACAIGFPGPDPTEGSNVERRAKLDYCVARLPSGLRGNVWLGSAWVHPSIDDAGEYIDDARRTEHRGGCMPAMSGSTSTTRSSHPRWL